MRPTLLGFRSPKERTPAFYTSTVCKIILNTVFIGYIWWKEVI